MDFSPANRDSPIYFESAAASIGCVNYGLANASAFEMTRSRPLLVDGRDDVCILTTETGLHVEFADDSFCVRPGGAAVLSKARAYRFVHAAPGISACVLVPHARLSLLVPRLEEAPMANLAPDTPGLELLFGYVRSVAFSETATTDIRSKSASHILDLIASILDPQREVKDYTDSESLAEARYEAIKRSVLDNLMRPGLSREKIARLHGLSERSVQRLFEQAGDSFSDFVRRERLAQALSKLRDPSEADRRILSIALDCGFNDITTFNRAFRRAYGMSPTEVREEALRAG